MAPSHSRQLLAWTFPTIAILLSYLWFKKRRIGALSDPGGTKQQITVETSERATKEPEKTPKKTERSFSRSLSGVDTAPIDIVLPRELRLAKSASIVISDEDLDLEIEKIRSMKTYSEPLNKPKPASVAKQTSSPVKTPSSPKKDSIPTSPVKSLVLNISQTESVDQNTPKMAQKDVVSVDEKFGALKLGNKESPKKKNKKQGKTTVVNTNSSQDNHPDEVHRQSSERDSANHSPADVMLASPSLSSISDNHSEVSCFCLHAFLFPLIFGTVGTDI